MRLLVRFSTDHSGRLERNIQAHPNHKIPIEEENGAEKRRRRSKEARPDRETA